MKTLILTTPPSRDLQSLAPEILEGEYDEVHQISPDGDAVDISREAAFAVKDYLRSKGWDFRESGPLEPGGDTVPKFMDSHLTNGEIFR